MTVEKQLRVGGDTKRDKCVKSGISPLTICILSVSSKHRQDESMTTPNWTISSSVGLVSCFLPKMR